MCSQRPKQSFDIPSGVVDWLERSVMPDRRPQPDTHRDGFTLLELLIAISVIAILMGLTFTVMNGVTNQAKSEATKATISKINRLLEQRSEGFDRAFKGARRDSYVKATVNLLTSVDARFDHYRRHPEQATGDILMLARKAAYRFEFPQRMPELILDPAVNDTNNNGLADSVEERVAKPAARAFLIEANAKSAAPTANFEPTGLEIADVATKRWNGGSATAVVGGVSTTFNFAGNNPVTVSSELLYFTLVASGTFGGSPVDSDQFSTSEVADADNDGLPEFIDGWGQPLRYYRWPTRMVNPTAPVFDIGPFDTDNSGKIDPPELASAEGANTYYPMFSNPNDPSETRTVSGSERLHASLNLKGLPPLPLPIGASTQRDMLLVDPDDPVGLLYSFLENPEYRSMGIATMNEFNESKYHTPDTYHTPLVVSSGPDQLLGLREPFETNAANGIYGNLAQYAGTFAPGFGTGPVPSTDVVEQLFDNVTSRNRRAGGNR
jgi:prepilin-type N-terminal cleavage/methylation domain-containing protein